MVTAVENSRKLAGLAHQPVLVDLRIGNVVCDTAQLINIAILVDNGINMDLPVDGLAVLCICFFEFKFMAPESALIAEEPIFSELGAGLPDMFVKAHAYQKGNL